MASISRDLSRGDRGGVGTDKNHNINHTSGLIIKSKFFEVVRVYLSKKCVDVSCCTCIELISDMSKNLSILLKHALQCKGFDRTVVVERLGVVQILVRS